MDLRRLSGKSFDDIENEIDDTDDIVFGGLEKNNDVRMKNDINRKKYFKQEKED